MRTLVLVLLVASSTMVGIGESHAAKARGPEDREFLTTSLCIGDAIPDDGVAGGTCAEGPQAGLPCDGSGKSKGLSAHCGVRPIGVPIRSIAEDADLAVQRAGVAGVGCPGPFPAPIALSISGRWHRTGGDNVMLPYFLGQSTPAMPITNEGGAWMRPNFIAPCAGLYMFTVEFVKDAYYFGGTTDDVNIYLTKTVGSGTPIYVGEAWSGEGAGRRGTGSYSVALRLNQLDSVQTWVHSDGGLSRTVAYYSFTGYRIAD